MTTVSQLAVLFILIALGYAGSALKALSPDSAKVMTKVVFTITLPCSILSSVIGGDLNIGGADTAAFMLMVIVVYLIYLALAFPAARLLGKDKNIRGLYSFMLIFSNVAFMGLPVGSAILGPESVFYIALFGIPFWITSFSFGLMLVAGKKGKFNYKEFITPIFISSILLIPLALTGFRAPDIIVNAVRLTGSITTPASMLIIGITLAQEPIRKIFTNWRLYPLSAVKLLIIPIVVFFVMRPFVESDIMLGVLVILSAMPTATVAAMFAVEYNNNESTASSGVFLTTLLSGVTIPLIVHFFLT
ncbi:MAG: AEC family transporter [Oscillospiraceae bacterium]|nr:AEC family transporter [Oscillospiraceae bacterium]